MSIDRITVIREFLDDGGYESVEEWAQDSDYRPTSNGWVDDNDQPVDIYGAIEGAIEASEFTEGGVIVHSPSGWTYRARQENGDNVDCHACGNPLSDDQPIVNDEDGFAYHEQCLED